MRNARLLALGLALIIGFSPVLAYGKEDLVNINGDNKLVLEEETYIEYKGKITDIIKDEEKNNMMIRVDGEEKNKIEKMIFHISEDMKILKEGSKEIIKRDDLKEGDEIRARYKEDTPMTMSIPPQLSPDLLYVDEGKDLISNFNRMIVKGKNINLQDKIYKSADGIYMIALRHLAEELGYDVKWNGRDRSVELTKGAQWSKLSIGKDEYNFAKMAIKLGKAPEIKDSRTYVPLSFIKQVLKQEIEINEGILRIK